MLDQDNSENKVTTFETPFEYPLIVPLQDADGFAITTINLQEPVISEIESLSDNTKKHGSMKAFKLMLANHTKMDIPTINKIGARDLNGIQKYYDYFLGE